MYSNSSGGYYKLYPVCSSTRCLDVYTANGYDRSNIDIYTDSTNSSRRFAIKQNSDGFSYRILTYSSSYSSAVTVSGGSCNNGANVFQYTYTSGAMRNDDWIFEPVNHVSNMGVKYAINNIAENPTEENERVVTYPNLNALGDCTNFVSQCLLASGIHMQNQWMINKVHNNNPRPNRFTVDDGWEYNLLGDAGSPWIALNSFCMYWNGHSYMHETISASSVISNPNLSYSRPYKIGDVIICKDGNTPKHALFIVGYIGENNGMTYTVASHTNDYTGRSLVTVASSISSEYSNPQFEFYSF